MAIPGHHSRAEGQGRAAAGLLGAMLRDVCHALMVVALFLAVLAPAAAAGDAAGYGNPDLTFASICGSTDDSGTGGDGAGHAPCHACRPDAVALPQPAGLPQLWLVALPAFAAVAPTTLNGQDQGRRAHRTRAPPPIA